MCCYLSRSYSFPANTPLLPEGCGHYVPHGCTSNQVSPLVCVCVCLWKVSMVLKMLSIISAARHSQWNLLVRAQPSQGFNDVPIIHPQHLCTQIQYVHKLDRGISSYQSASITHFDYGMLIWPIICFPSFLCHLQFLFLIQSPPPPPPPMFLPVPFDLLAVLACVLLETTLPKLYTKRSIFKTLANSCWLFPTTLRG